MSNFLATLGENFKTLFSNPLTIITLIGCAILLICLYMESKKIINKWYKWTYLQKRIESHGESKLTFIKVEEG